MKTITLLVLCFIVEIFFLMGVVANIGNPISRLWMFLAVLWFACLGFGGILTLAIVDDE
mgnify:CR=1 FL=1|jgi:predicted membrane protein